MSGKPPTTLPRRRLGRRLRELRLQAGLSIVDAARLIERGSGTLQRLEKGETPRIRLLDIQALCQIYDVPEELEDLLELAKVAAGSDGENGLWWHEYGEMIRADFELYVGLEASASDLTMYRSEIIPGLFQVPAYARALDAAYFPGATSEDLDQRVNVRLNRQRLVTRKRNPLRVDLIVDEAALRRMVGGPRVMAEQLRYFGRYAAECCRADAPLPKRASPRRCQRALRHPGFRPSHRGAFDRVCGGVPRQHVLRQARGGRAVSKSARSTGQGNVWPRRQQTGASQNGKGVRS